ncbi:MAG TPA: BTAD domain-containing putative transcriptional regulator, partial [Longimicrobium sp.]|nr:BTAD domain-containing putative transcriptional regulator [Longimicrobium sp.]
MSVRLYTLGRLALERDGAEVSGDAAQPRRLALMALLAAAPDGLTRDKVIGFLWAEQRSARAILNESVFVLRSVLGKPAIRTVGEILRLDPLEVWTDVRVFQERMVAGALHEAVELYRGPFLDGFYVRGTAEFEQWVGREQDRLRREYGRALEALAERAAAAGAAASAAEWWRRIAEHEEFSVRVAFRYVEALVQAGEPVLALRYAAAFTERMTKEMGVEPEGSVLEHARALASKAPPPAGSARFRAE